MNYNSFQKPKIKTSFDLKTVCYSSVILLNPALVEVLP